MTWYGWYYEEENSAELAAAWAAASWDAQLREARQVLVELQEKT